MLYLAGAICAVGLIACAIAWYAAWEIARSVRRAAPFEPRRSRPQVVIAATGTLPGLEALRTALAGQTVPLGALTFAVETASDPAFDRIDRVFDGFDPPVAIVVAGLTAGGGQKSRNLVAALRGMDDTRPLVLADVDIVPQPDWLATLLRPIERGRADIVSGYRWPVPLDARLPTLLVTWIDRSIAALPKPVGGHLIWGGSAALAAGCWTRIGLLDGLEREISDDLFLARLAREHGLRVTFPIAALPASPTAHDWRSMVRFGRRQYQMIRMYAPSAYLAAMATAAANLLGTAMPLVLLVTTRWAAVPYALMVGLALLTTRSRAELGVAVGNPRSPSEGRLSLLAPLLPIVHLTHLILILGGLRVRTVRWGRCTYRMAGRRVVAVERRPGP